MSHLKLVLIVATAVVAALALATWWPWLFPKAIQPSEDLFKVEKVDVNTLRQQVRKKWTRDNYSRYVEIEFSIDAEPVRNFTLRPGYYVYETAAKPLSDGAMYSRYEFNVTETEWGYEIVDVTYTNIVQGSRVIKGLPLVTHWRVVNNTLYLLYIYTGDSMYVEEVPIRPGSCTQFDSMVPVAPSIWPYVKEGATIRVKNRWNVTDLRINFTSITDVTATFKVDKKLVDCNGPSGKCYVVEMEQRIKSRTKSESRNEEHASTKIYRHVYLIDLSGVVVQARSYDLAASPHKLISEINLVEWK
ncbi:MAG: hypothetical protein QXJ71_06875 [Pyrobaculum sp.]